VKSVAANRSGQKGGAGESDPSRRLQGEQEEEAEEEYGGKGPFAVFKKARAKGQEAHAHPNWPGVSKARKIALTVGQEIASSSSLRH
jgi:hypothetical protein